MRDCLICGLLLIYVTAAGQEQAAAPVEPAQPEAPQQKIIQAAAEAYKLYADQENQTQELVRSARPLLRFDDAVTFSQHGSVYVWTDRDRRPLAVASLYFQADGARVDEFQSLVAVGTIRAEFEGKEIWSPKMQGIEFKILGDGQDVSAVKERRLGEMRNIARRFSGSVADRRAGRLELRLLPQPLYRYSDEANHLADGAVFGFAKGTNPEILLLLEARSPADTGRWHYALARMSARGCNVKLDEQEIWTLPAVGYKQDADQPYFNRYTP